MVEVEFDTVAASPQKQHGRTITPNGESIEASTRCKVETLHSGLVIINHGARNILDSSSDLDKSPILMRDGFATAQSTCLAISRGPFDENSELISAPEMRRRFRHAVFRQTRVEYRLFTPSFLSALRPWGIFLRTVPMDAQYSILVS